MFNGLGHKHAYNHTSDKYLNIDVIQLHVWYKRGPWRGEAACPVHVARAGAGAGESCSGIDWSQSGPASSQQPAAGTGRGKISMQM